MSGRGAERRLKKLEASLTPSQAVSRWLDEGQAFASLDAYLGAVLREPLSPTPMDRVIGSVEGGVREALRGQPRDAIETAIRNAARQAAFRYLLVLRLNIGASEEARVKALAASCLFFWMRALASDDVVQTAMETIGKAAEGDGRPSAWRRWRETVIGLLAAVYVEDEARRLLERDYLDGHPSLFADVERDWSEAVEQVERVARFALFLEHLGDDDPPTSLNEVSLDGCRAAVTAGAAERAAYLADVVRANTLQIAGEEARAAEILATRFGAS